MRRGAFTAAVVGLVLTAPVVAVPSYDFPAPRPFSGERWHNPYAGWRGRFLKVNLHAHSGAWLGLTAGADTPEAMARRYAEFGYDALALSNYHQVTEVEGAPLPMLRAYEHGYNLSKAHRLVLGTSTPVNLDFPLSTRSMRQWLLDVLGARSALVGLNHPSLRAGHDCDEVERLTGFRLLEVHNAYATSHLEWDCALTAGRLAWGIGNDDSHSAREEGIGVAWNMVAAEAPTEAALLEALAAGRSYTVRGERGRMDVRVVEVSQDEPGLFRLELDGPARVEWVVDGSVRQADDSVSTARFSAPVRSGHYVRAVVRTPITEILLNPFVRAGAWTPPVATIDWPLTALGWVAWLVGAAVTAWLRPRATPRLRLVHRDERAA
ncbi:MAG: hypothetical protein INH37_00395 [Myxococcaceae bacterium]|nr:hypothetical protein [Myxococcaceae bacterium]